MSENKTKPTDASVTKYIAAIPDAERRADCETLISLMIKITGEQPKMWGPSLIGFGNYNYTYESGHSGQSSLVAFASRKIGMDAPMSG